MQGSARPGRQLAVGILAVVAALGAILVVVGRSWLLPRASLLPALPALSASATVIKSTPNVILAVRDLARLETASFHIERVIDLTEQQSQLFGLIQAEDAILLVAVADVGAGVDLAELPAEHIELEPSGKGVAIRLPAPRIFRTALDNEKTYVHTRRTGMLARRAENLETRARQAAEKSLLEAAKEAGILERAGENARRVVEGLARSLGYERVEVTIVE